MKLQSMCFRCKHLDQNSNRQKPLCAAFPDGIPADIFEGRFDHRVHHEGDNGVLFEADSAISQQTVERVYGVEPVPGEKIEVTESDGDSELDEMLTVIR